MLSPRRSNSSNRFRSSEPQPSWLDFWNEHNAGVAPDPCRAVDKPGIPAELWLEEVVSAEVVARHSKAPEL